MRRWTATLVVAVMVCVAGMSCVPVRHGAERAGVVVATTQPAPAVVREFRGVWVASVENINWPSRKGLGEAEQKAELLELLDRAAGANFNAVLLQVRPGCDALYESRLEPWSVFLTGEQGKSPGYDPLAFAVEAAHARGLELHAWVNPFRVRGKGNVSPAAVNGVEARHPDWVRDYGDGTPANTVRWLDPGEPAARAHSLTVIADLVARYDIDGVHIDDYFYPYPVAGKEFPDDETFARYGEGKSRGDFRRENINRFVRAMYEQTKAPKPWVKVGISPFGIWRPGNPAQVTGFDAYDKIYGDSRLWLREGWADYVSPQLYWPIDRRAQSFPALLGWWVGENVKGRCVWPGLYTTLAQPGGNRPEGRRWSASEIEYQVKTIRGLTAEPGAVHFSASFLQGTTRPVAEHLKSTVYEEPAAVPAMPWLGGPEAGEVRVVWAKVSGGGTGRVRVGWSGGENASRFVVRWRESGKSAWRQVVLPATQDEIEVSGSAGTEFWVAGQDRVGRIGKGTVVRVE